MTTPESFAPGYRLTDGNQLNYRIANPQWSTTSSVSATPGGTMGTSAKIANAVTNVTAASAPGAGLTLPQAIMGTVLIVNNNSLNDVRIFSDGDSTINGLPGAIGILLQKGTAGLFTATATKEWTILNTTGNTGIAVVATIAALPATVSATLYFVEGYYAAGDGGGGYYYGATGGSYTNNGGSIIVPGGGTGTSAWLLLPQSIYNVAQFGAVGDNVTDDFAAFTNCLTAIGNMGGGTVQLMANKIYNLSDGPIVPANVKLNLNGATVNLNFTGSTYKNGFKLRDNTWIYNGTINVTEPGSPASGDKSLYCNIVVGSDGTVANSVGFSNFRIFDLTLTNARTLASGPTGGFAVLIQSVSNNGIVENLRFPSSSTLACGISVSWNGGGSATPGLLFTYNPHSINIRNIWFGDQTFNNVIGDVSCIDVVAAYNVTIQNVNVEGHLGDSVIQIRNGAFGKQAAPPTVQDLLFNAVSVKNLTVGKCNIAVSVYGYSHGLPASGFPAEYNPDRVLIENVCANGLYVNGGAGGSGNQTCIYISKTSYVSVNNCSGKYFIAGIVIAESATDIYVSNCQFYFNQTQGVVAANSTVPPERVILNNVDCGSNGQSGSNSVGFYIDACFDVQLINCTAGAATGEITQTIGYQVGSGAVNTKFTGVNKVRYVASGGTPYQFLTAVIGDRSFHGGTSSSLSTSASQFAPLMGIGTPTASQQGNKITTSTQMLLTNWYVELDVAPGTGNSRDIRIILNGGASLETTVSGTATSGYSYSVATVTPGSTLCVQAFVDAGTPAATNAYWSCEAILI